MRLGVLDIGSNTVHLIVVDAYSGAPPVPMRSLKTSLKLASQIDARGNIPDKAITQLIKTIKEFAAAAREMGCKELLTFATSAIRDALNADTILSAIKKKTSVDVTILSGKQEAEVTYFAVRRWFGWSAGTILALDIGGGSVEISFGNQEKPSYTTSLPIGTGRVMREFSLDAPSEKSRVQTLDNIQEWLRGKLKTPAKTISEQGPVDLVVGTSKTFKTLVAVAGSVYSEPHSHWQSTSGQAIQQISYFLSRMHTSDIAKIPQVNPSRADQVIPGAQIASSLIDVFNIDTLHLCPWALREGIILQRIDDVT